MYSIDMVVKELVLSSDEIDSQIRDLLSSSLRGGIPQEVLTITRAGCLVVEQGIEIGALQDSKFIAFFSENYNPDLSDFQDRSNRTIFGFLESLETVANFTGITIVYFHNFSRFDGIMILKYYTTYGGIYTIKSLIKNLRIYTLEVYKGTKFILIFWDSLTLLPGSLAELAKTLCPHLGYKGSILHDKVKLSTLQIQRNQLLNYTKQDICLLAGVVYKAQEIYWTKYGIDITLCLTLSSLAMKIYRSRYYKDKEFLIHIPNRNEDKFFRTAYYGGHPNMYKPYGKNIYYYDVNSLYPFIMKTYPMPCGKPVWNGNVRGIDLSVIYGFIQAYIITPKNIDKPFLPIRDKNGSLLFPKGKFIGAYLSDELRYAQKLEYKIFPLKGYTFEKKPTPFKNFIFKVCESRLTPKKSGDDAMSYGYKILINSLYGRFGINPESTITEIVKRDKYKEITQREKIIMGNKLSDDYCIVSYIDADSAILGKPLSKEYVSSKTTPGEGTWMLNTDRSHTNVRGGYGGLVRNHGGTVFFAYHGMTQPSSVVEQEALKAIERGLTIILQADISRICVGTGSLQMISYIKVNNKPPWRMLPPSRSMSSSLNPMEQSPIPSPIHIGGSHEHFDTSDGGSPITFYSLFRAILREKGMSLESNDDLHDSGPFPFCLPRILDYFFLFSRHFEILLSTTSYLLTRTTKLVEPPELSGGSLLKDIDSPLHVLDCLQRTPHSSLLDAKDDSIEEPSVYFSSSSNDTSNKPSEWQFS
ncbi:hypothetical protein GIB67_034661 [Kingdonia uniflora]|uniref:DNA-directed DNA polymerase n=1 Tax=Kingdonia uniflora TaxID=39325 RepID=A0A7J7P041_9MAGN|nr:hypothetical protein GIB67_034661 [Kingdonia uniflora]